LRLGRNAKGKEASQTLRSTRAGLIFSRAKLDCWVDGRATIQL